MGDLDGRVVANEELGGGYWRLSVRLDRPAAEPLPGQFVMLRVSSTSDPLLRRPFGIHDFYCSTDGVPHLAILYQLVGRGTHLMTGLKTGDHVEMLGPLGHGFDPPPAGAESVIVAGGIGAAPLLYLARWLVDRGDRPAVFGGGRTADHLLSSGEFETLGLPFHASTDDGSRGFRGTVVDLLRAEATGKDLLVYACGPRPMLAALARQCRQAGWSMQGSLDTPMACGLGLCLGCAVEAAPGSERKYLMVCKDGPVFNLEELRWESLISA